MTTMMIMMAINMTMNLAVWNRVDWDLGITLWIHILGKHPGTNQWTHICVVHNIYFLSIFQLYVFLLFAFSPSLSLSLERAGYNVISRHKLVIMRVFC